MQSGTAPVKCIQGEGVPDCLDFFSSQVPEHTSWVQVDMHSSLLCWCYEPELRETVHFRAHEGCCFFGFSVCVLRLVHFLDIRDNKGQHARCTKCLKPLVEWCFLLWVVGIKLVLGTRWTDQTEACKLLSCIGPLQ